MSNAANEFILGVASERAIGLCAKVWFVKATKRLQRLSIYFAHGSKLWTLSYDDKLRLLSRVAWTKRPPLMADVILLS